MRAKTNSPRIGESMIWVLRCVAVVWKSLSKTNRFSDSNVDLHMPKHVLLEVDGISDFRRNRLTR